MTYNIVLDKSKDVIIGGSHKSFDTLNPENYDGLKKKKKYIKQFLWSD